MILLETNAFQFPCLMVFAVPVDHPVLSVGANFQLEGCYVVGLLGLLGDSSLRSDSGQNLEELKIHLGKK